MRPDRTGKAAASSIMKQADSPGKNEMVSGMSMDMMKLEE